jgi:hypothetical protein
MRLNGLFIGLLSGLALTACGMSAEEAAGTETPSESQSELLSYPTKWTLTNSTTQSLTFKCTCPKPYGLPFPINMTTTTVAAGQSTVHSWSDFHNDGLGLNSCGAWNCSTTTTGGSVYATATFSTSWGQDITLKALTGGQLVKQ